MPCCKIEFLPLGLNSFLPFFINLFNCRLEKVVEPWIEGLYPAIRNHLNKTGTVTDNVIQTDVINETVMPDTIFKEENSIKDVNVNMANEKNDSEKVPPNISIVYSKELENSSKIIVLQSLLTFSKSQMSIKDLALELWSKNL